MPKLSSIVSMAPLKFQKSFSESSSVRTMGWDTDDSDAIRQRKDRRRMYLFPVDVRWTLMHLFPPYVKIQGSWYFPTEATL
jgi:hypothetical protein